MLLRLSRLSLGLAASAAVVALFAPTGHQATLAAFSSFSGLFGLGLWRSAAKEAAGELVLAAEPPTAMAVAAPALLDAATRLTRDAQAAPDVEAAMLATAAVLRGELGAAVTRVHLVEEILADQVLVRDLVASEPGFKTAAHTLRLGRSVVAEALRHGRETGRAPGDAAVPVLRDGRVVALVVLEGISLPIDAGALADLLALARSTLSRLAQPPGHATAGPPNPSTAEPEGEKAQPNVLVVEDSHVHPASAARMLRRLGCRVTTASGMLDGLNALRETQFDLILVDLQSSGTGAADDPGRWWRGDGSVDTAWARDTPAIALADTPLPGGSERLRELGFDDHLCKPFRQARLLDMLNRHLRREAPVDRPGGSSHAWSVPPLAAGPSDADPGSPSVLDATALARLSELDPTGRNQLLERVMQAFKTSVARLRPQLDTARSANDIASIKLVAHTLKSSSASIGALRLSTLCADVETTIRVEPATDLAPRLAALDEALDGALAAIDDLLKGRT